MVACSTGSACRWESVGLGSTGLVCQVRIDERCGSLSLVWGCPDQFRSVLSKRRGRARSGRVVNQSKG